MILLSLQRTWLTGNVSDQKIVGDVNPAGYSFHHAGQIQKKGGSSGGSHDSTLRDIVDEHAPLRTKEMPRRPMLLWYNKNTQAAKRQKVL